MTDRLYQNLVESVKSGAAMIVVGTGVSIGATGDYPTASWRGLLRSGLTCARDIDPSLSEEWAQRVRGEIDADDLDDLLSAAEKISRKLGAPSGGEFRRWLRESYENVPVTDCAAPEAIAALNLPILTTNYDDVLQSVVEGSPVTWQQPEALQRVLRGDDRSVGYLHGHYKTPESVVLGIRSYEAVLNAPAIQALQRAISTMTTLIFVGMGSGLDDPNWSALFDFVNASIPNSDYRHYRLCLKGDVRKLSEKHRDSPLCPLSFGEENTDLGIFLQELGEVSERASAIRAKSEMSERGLGKRSTRYLWDQTGSSAQHPCAVPTWVGAVCTMDNTIRLLDRGVQGSLFAVDEGSLGEGAASVRISPDGTAVGTVHHGQLLVNWLSQSGTIDAWAPLDVNEFSSSPNAARLLAVERKGSRSVLCLVSEASSTYIVRVWPSGANRDRAEFVREVCQEPSSAGVLWNEKAVLVCPDENGRRTTRFFPELSDITAIDAAFLNHSLFVAALGLDNKEAVAIHLNGRRTDAELPDSATAVGLVHGTPGRLSQPSLAVLNTNGLRCYSVKVAEEWTTTGWL